ncbi:uncharacterized protein MYCFIDRAFT_131051 [Pseudocercospora fijiensis CIRAD86]|uniref:DNA polymerase n=1 Tax=Pseudocercospora fijiensis (strain CIRAD86) TaxID=383855 RepID=M3BBB3_PSEFD|nr:uncharacterized protein MYCFIDRAFT_131051 [Pseudocercospora fijiensis CIRAD86]EME86508.1 hypothetical protein MYCFIDRAFT_131051 [Pseudocercospora fijiensis CIRAD86]
MDNDTIFRLRLNCVDHYQAPPTSLDPPIWGPQTTTSTQLGKLPDVPVIRVFGSTETGQKVCCHIRGAFPYLYVPYTESIANDDVARYISTFRHSIDHALALSYRRNPYDDPRKATFVAHISLVKGVPFFGYNVGHKYFLKVYLLNPLHMTRFSDLLQQGAILRQLFQPYEAHLQYLLQWMCDFNLYGCAYIESKKPRFRAPLPAWEELDDPAHLWHDHSILPRNVLDADKFPRQSHCQLELDLCVEDILNRNAIEPRPLHHSFIERLSSLENLPPDEKLVHSMAGLWKDETRRRRLRMGLTDPFSSPFPPELLVSMSADPRNDSKGGWIHEDEFREMVNELAEQEKKARGGGPISFESFSSQANNDDKDGVKTVLSSVDDLFHTKHIALTQRLKLGEAGLTGSMGEATVDGSAVEIESEAGKLDPTFDRNAHGSLLPGSDGFDLPQAAQISRLDTSNDHSAKSLSSAQPSASQRSQGSQGVRHAFPAVKNPHDAETQARLSQRDDLSQICQRNSSSSKKTAQELLAHNSVELPASSQKFSADVGPKVPTRVVAKYARTFGLDSDKDVFVFGSLPPSYQEVNDSLAPSVIYQDAYYSSEKDVPERPREYAGQEFRLESNTLLYLHAFDRGGSLIDANVRAVHKPELELAEQSRSKECSLRTWEIAKPPPTYAEVQTWLKDEAPQEENDLDWLEVDGPPAASQLRRKNKPPPELSQIEGPTQKNKHGAKYSQKNTSTSVQHETGYMSTMSLEVHVNTRGDLVPDPERDEVNMVVWCIADDQMDEKTVLGIAVLAQEGDEDRLDQIRRNVGNDTQLDCEDNELDLINRMVDIVRQYDPDILTGFEVHNGSWGYLIERARLQYEFNLPDEFSRMKSKSHGRFGKDADRWGFTQTSTVSITGRHTINIWRAMRSELNLLQYTMENVVFHLLHRRIPHYSFATLTRWYQSKKPRDLTRLLDYLITRTRLDLEILDANELIPRTSEQARLLGVDFFSVFSRGSQFKVESLMFRIAKPESFVLVSPSRKQVGAQNALECLPLVMEPQSAFYSSPLVVLDFQSLYPSVMIAYNYCYSTCLGRIVNWRGTNKLGFADFQRAPGLLELVQDRLNISPNGMMYVKPEMRKSLLAKMLGEILETRVMVKSGMKVDKDDRTLQQLLNNRQLALKLIANVTYGYTSASFSGRMPCSEIADSIVQTGRETLEKAIAFIHSVERWGAEVVYGDTDSLFVYLKGRTRDDAFKIGDEIAKAVTDMNPRPVKLKFEKVYHPCVLLAKKRYVGFKYESPKQTEPEFDAKGIETVRRDGTPAEQKIEEKALKLLFRTADLSQIKQYFQTQCTKIMAGRVSVQDFCFAKEVKLGTYADKSPPPPGALIATKRMLRDPRMEPQYGERVPYVVIAGAPGARLWERCVEPERLIYDENAELDAEYYISKNLIPPLERIFNLVGANVRQWFDEMPKVQRIRMLGAQREGEINARGRKTMESYMGSSLCLVCRTKLDPTEADAEELELPLCAACRYEDSTNTLLALRRKYQKVERKVTDLQDVCKSCAGLAFDDEVRCDSRDCPVFYSRVKANTQLGVARNGIGKVLEEFEREVLKREDLEW